MRSHPAISRISRKRLGRQRSWFRGVSLGLVTLLLLPSVGLVVRPSTAESSGKLSDGISVVSSATTENVSVESSFRTAAPASGARPAGATITVTDLTQKISDSGGCSLPEAIYAANFDRNIAIDSTDPDHFVVTHCTPGNGDDTIVLPAGAVFQMSGIILDAYNPYGPTATPIIFSNIDIEANGSTFQRVSTTENFRAFSVGSASINVPALGGTAKTISGTGQLKINSAYIKNFKAKGGNGASGGGGGMGAGGAIYLQSGELTLVNSTFENNSAIGGNGSDEVTSFPEPGGGGGGLSGNGGAAVSSGSGAEGGGGGGGGSRGNGEANGAGYGGGGGGTYVDGLGENGGFRCGGTGGHFNSGFPGNVDATDGSCAGGGGGAGAEPLIGVGLPFPLGGDGANGNYGGGGGGGGVLGSDIGEKGGNGGYGGGGGAGAHDGDGGNGGFGGGGAGGHHAGSGGLFGGNGTADNGHGANGGGGAGLGGAIFNESGTVMIFNSTFTANTAFGGAGGDSASSITASSGDGQGNAIFSLDGSTVITHVTVSNNGGGADIADVVIVANGVTAGLFLSNSILANNLGGGPNGKFVALNTGNVSQTNTGNLIEANGASDGSGKFTGVTTALDPQLSALTLNIPGSTPTMAIGTSSPAYGTANLTKCQATDQRGVSRKPGCDIGAYERNEFKQSGSTFTVTNTTDHDDGTCGIIDCTLREAISAANTSTGGAITINFAGNVTGTILLDRNLGSLFVGNLTVGSITINGPGAGVLSISGNANIKVFSFPAGTSTVSGLTIRDGFPPSGSGTVIGGGMSVGSAATVTLNDCAFVNNRLLASSGATAGANGNIAQGGAIANSGVLTLNRCTFSNNEALAGSGFPNTGIPHFGGSGGAGQGGAVYNSPSGTLAVNNCTFFNNLALGGNGANNTDFGGGNGGAGSGGAISNLGTMTLTACTLAGNTGTGGNGGSGRSFVDNGVAGKGSGGIATSGNSTVRNCISAGNTGNHGGGTDVDGTLTSGGYNLIGIGDGSIGLTGTGDQVGTAVSPLNAKLGPLANNGGLTQTMALLIGSPAIDKGKSFGPTPDTDQRGLPRPVNDPAIQNASGGDGSDIGAFEVQTLTPTLQFSSAAFSVNENAGTAIITVTRANDLSVAATVNYATSNGTATAGTDYTATSGTLSFAIGDTSKTFPIPIINDSLDEPNETVNLTLSNVTGNAALGTPSTAVLTIIDDDAPVVQFSAGLYVVGEGDQRVTLTVTRSGDASAAAAVGFVTSDSAGSQSCNVFNGKASSRCDYLTSIGPVQFAPGETSKIFSIPIIDDSYAEGNETFTVSLNNVSGASLGTQSTTTVMIVDNDNVTGPNPIDQSSFFVRQHYLDFLNREPDTSGFNFWVNNIESCGADANCRAVKRIDTSAAFFLSIEFQQTGYLVERIYKASYGDATGASTLGGAHQLLVPIVRLNEFLPDTQEIGRGVIIGQTGWETALENNKQAFTSEFVQRSRFVTAFPTSMTPAQFVDKLFANAGVTPTGTDRTAAVNEFGGATTTSEVAARSRALRRVAENATLSQQEFNRAFVLMQFLGYLRRNPNDAPDADHTGYDFWLAKLNQFNGNYGDAEMVKAFISSLEYRQRFGP
jgi:CSLREA domain-containing protein